MLLIENDFLKLAGGAYNGFPHGLVFGAALVHELAHHLQWSLLEFLYAQGLAWLNGAGTPPGQTNYVPVIKYHLENKLKDGTIACLEAAAYKQSVRDACCRCKVETDPERKADWDALAEAEAIEGWAYHQACIGIASDPDGQGGLPIPPEPTLDSTGCPIHPQPPQPEGDPTIGSLYPPLDQDGHAIPPFPHPLSEPMGACDCL